MKHMKQLSLRFAFVLLAAFAFTTAWAQSPVERAGQVLDRLDAGQFDEVVADFDADMAAQIDAATLSQVWASIPAQAGARQARGEPVEAEQDGYRIVMIPLQHEQAVLALSVAFNQDDQISGLVIQPAQPQQPAPEQQHDHEQHGHEGHEGHAAEPADGP